MATSAMACPSSTRLSRPVRRRPPRPLRRPPPEPPAGGAVSDGDAISAFAGSDRARAALDALLRSMVERGASDLHLRCGEPPIVRLHGEMTRLDGAPLDAPTLDAMIRSVMPERNRREYRETNDSDYAYE